MLLPNYNERLIDSASDAELKAKDNRQEEEHLKIRRVTPPPQFQDKLKSPYDADSHTDKNLTHDSKREKLKDDEPNFTELRMNPACTSTPKMVAPKEYMNGGQNTKNAAKNSLRINVMENLNSG